MSNQQLTFDDVSARRRKRLGGEATLNHADLVDTAHARGRVRELLSDGRWHSATEIIAAAGQREALRRLRELRQPPHNLTVERRRAEGREWLYRIAPQINERET